MHVYGDIKIQCSDSISIAEGWGGSPDLHLVCRREMSPSAHHSTWGMSSGFVELLASPLLTDDQPDSITSRPIRRSHLYLIPQVGFPTDEPVEKERCFYWEPTNGSVKMWSSAKTGPPVFRGVMLSGDSIEVFSVHVAVMMSFQCFCFSFDKHRCCFAFTWSWFYCVEFKDGVEAGLDECSGQ